jgi:hypothetical protein
MAVVNPCLRNLPLPMSQDRTCLLLAEREGFEPPIPVKVCPLSRRIVSTTHAPLRAVKIRGLLIYFIRCGKDHGAAVVPSGVSFIQPSARLSCQQVPPLSRETSCDRRSRATRYRGYRVEARIFWPSRPCRQSRHRHKPKHSYAQS